MQFRSSTNNSYNNKLCHQCKIRCTCVCVLFCLFVFSNFSQCFHTKIKILKSPHQQLFVKLSFPISGRAGLLQGLAGLVGGHVGRCRPLVVFSNESNVKWFLKRCWLLHLVISYPCKQMLVSHRGISFPQKQHEDMRCELEESRCLIPNPL